LFSDIPNNRTLRPDEPTNTVSAYEHDNNYADGRTLDRLGRVITCEQGTRRVVRQEHDGSITVIADTHGGGRLTSQKKAPNTASPINPPLSSHNAADKAAMT
jgi:gluconolactonase